MQNQNPNQNPPERALPCDLSMPATGSVVGGVLFLFEPEQHARDQLLLNAVSAYEYVVDVHGENDLLPPGWLLLSNDRHALFKALVHWDEYPWAVEYVQGKTGGFWMMDLLPLLWEGCEPSATSELARAVQELTDSGLSAAAVKERFLDALTEDWFDAICDAGWFFSSTRVLAEAVHNGRSNQQDLARSIAVSLNIPVPSGLDAKDLDDWITRHTLDYLANKMAALLGLRRPRGASRQSLQDWVDSWRDLYEAMAYGEVAPNDLARLKIAWMLETQAA